MLSELSISAVRAWIFYQRTYALGQDFPVSLIRFFEYLLNLRLHLGRNARSHWDEFHHITRLPQQILDPGNVRKVMFARSFGHGEITRFLDQLTGAYDTLFSGDKFCHTILTFLE